MVVGLSQVKVTPLVGRYVPFSNSACTAAGQVMVQAPEVEERRKHMFDLSVTFLISKWDRFRLVRPLHSLNIPFILVTFMVLKLERSRPVKLLHP